MNSETHPAIGWIHRGSDGPSFGYDYAKICCSECDGFEGLECVQEGCTVRLVSTQKQHDERFRQEMREREAERRRYREERRSRQLKLARKDTA